MPEAYKTGRCVNGEQLHQSLQGPKKNWYVTYPSRIQPRPFVKVADMHAGCIIALEEGLLPKRIDSASLDTEEVPPK